MNNEELKMLIKQIRKYELGKYFDTTEEFDIWLNNLKTKHIKNIISLTVDPKEILFSKSILINENLLNCDDYLERIKAMMKIKNAEGCYHLFDSLYSPNFLNSKNYYEDIELISKAISARYPLWIINKDSFINSPYHQEDLKLIAEAKDIKHEKRDWFKDMLVEEALSVVAGNADSINSPYHQKDMQLIANSGSDCLQMSCSSPERSLNNLAINKVSLKDKYHLENMQILSKCPVSAKYLFKIMTNPEIINGKYYREEVKALANAKNKINALALYYYITNANQIGNYEDEDLLLSTVLYYRNFVKITKELKEQKNNNNNPNYLKDLSLLNQVNDNHVLFIELLLTNKNFINSKYYEQDLNVILSIENDDIFLDIYTILTNTIFLNSTHHIKDLDTITKTKDNLLRNWLIKKATSKDSINSCYHEYDMEYISKLKLDGINNNLFHSIHFYLFDKAGINNQKHIEILEKLANGIDISESNMLNHLNYLENNPENITSSKKIPKLLNIVKKIRRS